MLRLDHLAVAAGNLAEGVDWVESTLGIRLAAGGEHPHMSTHNRLLGLGDVYLEVIAINPLAPAPPHPRWFDLDHFAGRPRLTNWIVACDDIDAAAAALPRSGVVTDLARGDFSWRMAIPADGCLPFGGAQPALIQWLGDAHPTQRLKGAGVRLERLEVATPDHSALGALLADLHEPRLVIVPGKAVAMRATFTTPSGKRVLE